MATFSTNLVNHLFVVKSAVAYTTMPTAEGAATFKNCGNGQIALSYVGKGGLSKSDFIKTSTIRNLKVTKGSALKRGLRKVEVTLKSEYLNNGSINNTLIPAGTECLLRTTFFQYGAPSNEEQIAKLGATTVTSGMTAEQFYTNLKNNLVANYSHEPIQLLDFSLKGVKATKTMSTNTGITITANSIGTAGNSIKFAINSITETWVENTIPGKVTVTVAGGITTIAVGLQSTRKTIADLKAIIAAYPEVAALITITGTDATTVAVETAVTLEGGSTTGIVVEEIMQPFIVGRLSSDPLNFVIEFNSSDIYHSSGPITLENIVWGTATDVASTSFVGVGYKVADMEYFFHGERGDVYRGVGFPNVINTKYFADTSKVYNLIDMDFNFSDGGFHPQESLKHITIACEETSETDYTVTNALITALNGAAGSTLANTLL